LPYSKVKCLLLRDPAITPQLHQAPIVTDPASYCFIGDYTYQWGNVRQNFVSQIWRTAPQKKFCPLISFRVTTMSKCLVSETSKRAAETLGRA
jgi:hypothetical protein